MLPAINTSSSALLELGEMQSKAREEVTSPTTIIRRRRPSFHVSKQIQIELAHLQEAAMLEKAPVSGEQLRPKFRANSFFRRDSIAKTRSQSSQVEEKKRQNEMNSKISSDASLSSYISSNSTLPSFDNDVDELARVVGDASTLGAKSRNGRMLREKKDRRKIGVADSRKVVPKNEKRWRKLFAKVGWRSSQELKDLMAAGVPKEHRPYVWKHFLRIDKFKSFYPSGYFKSLKELIRKMKGDLNTLHEINKDIQRTMPEYFATEEKKTKLKNVLYAHALRTPDVVGYCQGMNFLCAGLLTVFEDEEDAFWALCVLVEMRLGYYTPTMISLKVDQHVLNRLLSYKKANMARHLDRPEISISISHFTTSWLLCLFMKNPVVYETAIELWDYILCFGDEMIFLIALQIFEEWSPTVLKMNSADELMTFLLKCTLTKIDKTKILNNIGSLSPHIESLRTYYKGFETKKARKRLDALSLADKFSFPDANEIHRLWSIFSAGDPWNIMLTETVSQVPIFAKAFYLACYPNEPEKLCSHGLMSGFIQRMFDILDENNTRNVTFKRFLKVVHTLKYGAPRERLRVCFQFFDLDGDGMLTASDLKIGFRLITDMIHGESTEEDEKSITRIAEEFVKIGHSQENTVSKRFDEGPFGLQLNTEGVYPKITKILCLSTIEKGVKAGWELIGIDNISFKRFTYKDIYTALQKVKFPAVAHFRVRHLTGNPREKLALRHFAKIVSLHRETEILFRLQGAIYDWKNISEQQKKKVPLPPMVHSPPRAVRSLGRKAASIKSVENSAMSFLDLQIT
ncbi:hypothetical protein AAMO2058_000781700 [Amorphochlora amoebiformis]